ncbi:MAG: zf-HC2 domain-containing protein [Candidatus Firestonebacteria bacterium]
MKNCKKIIQKIPEYIYGELPAEEKALVFTHLKNCSSCAKELKTTSAVLKKVSQLKRPALPSSLYPAVLGKLEQRKAAAGKFWNLPFAAGFCLLILLAVFSNNHNTYSIRNINSGNTANEEKKSTKSKLVAEGLNEEIDLLSELDYKILDELFPEQAKALIK